MSEKTTAAVERRLPTQDELTAWWVFYNQEIHDSSVSAILSWIQESRDPSYRIREAMIKRLRLLYPAFAKSFPA